jgi:integrase
MAPLPKYLTQDELKRFSAAIESPRDKALFGLIYHYGLRVGEALMLTVDDVNFKNHRITIRRLKNGLGGEKPLWRHIAKFLRSYLWERRDVGPYLFTGRKGPLQKRQVQQLFTDYADAAGIQAAPPMLYATPWPCISWRLAKHGHSLLYVSGELPRLPSPLLRPLPVTGHDADMLDVEAQIWAMMLKHGCIGSPNGG